MEEKRVEIIRENSSSFNDLLVPSRFWFWFPNDAAFCHIGILAFRSTDSVPEKPDSDSCRTSYRAPGFKSWTEKDPFLCGPVLMFENTEELSPLELAVLSSDWLGCSGFC